MSVFLLQYLSGFGNEFSSEDPRCPGSLPEGQVTHTKYTLTIILSIINAIIYLLILLFYAKENCLNT